MPEPAISNQGPPIPVSRGLWSFPRNPNTMGRMATTIALVTGANKGIGFEIARGLAAKGAHVLVGARDADRGRAAAATITSEGGSAEFVELDVTRPDTAAALAEDVDRRFGRLDILVNNAGVFADDGDTTDIRLSTMEHVFAVNVFGVVTVTNALAPLLRAADAARIVNVSSELGSATHMSDPTSLYTAMQPGAYGASKAALNLLTVSYAKQFQDTPIRVNAISPGYCATDMNGHVGPRSAVDGAGIAVELALAGADAPQGTFRTDDPLAAGTVLPW
ncbi:NADP-dependent 7-alpha-hydroxysteroid dehydrogenase [Stackebrandtia soli]